MEFRPGNSAVFAGSEDHEVTAGEKVRRRKTPLGKIGGIVGQIPAVEVDGVGPGIVELDPIRVLPVLVRERGVIQRHELGNEDVRVASGRDCHQQYQRHPPRATFHALHREKCGSNLQNDSLSRKFPRGEDLQKME